MKKKRKVKKNGETVVVNWFQCRNDDERKKWWKAMLKACAVDKPWMNVGTYSKK